MEGYADWVILAIELLSMGSCTGASCRNYHASAYATALNRVVGGRQKSYGSFFKTVTAFWNARARWLSVFFSSSVISAYVRE
jgi:hypothetical protein